MQGYGRATRFRGFLADGAGVEWSERTVLFMDALELDCFDKGEVGVLDLIEVFLAREIRKVVTTFSAAATSVPRSDQSRGFGGVVITGLWRCRSFGGD